jgi:hypothetical protein
MTRLALFTAWVFAWTGLALLITYDVAQAVLR